MKIIGIALSLLLLSACAAVQPPPSPDFQIPTGAKIGLLIHTTDNPTHTHIGTTVFNNFVQQYPYDWNTKTEITSRFEQAFQVLPGIELVDLTTYQLPVEQYGIAFTQIKDKQWTPGPNTEQLREKLLSDNIQIVIQLIEIPTVALMQCGNMGCTYFRSEGHGLFTRSFLGMSQYIASASYLFRIDVLDPAFSIHQHPELAALNQATSKNMLMRSFRSPAVFKEITEEELEPVKHQILSYIETLAEKTVAELMNYAPITQNPALSASSTQQSAYE